MIDLKTKAVLLVRVKRFPWRCCVVLLALSLLSACGQAREPERLMALAEKTKHTGELQVAADLYHKAAALTPRHVDIQYGAALVDIQVENFTEAEEHLRQALTLRPDFEAAHLNLGVILVKQGHKEQGRSC